MIIVLDNIRSCYNVGSILRTCDGFGVKQIIAIGQTPYFSNKDDRPPHVRLVNNKQIAKVALGAELNVKMSYFQDQSAALNYLSENGYRLCIIEQSQNSEPIQDLPSPSQNLALVLGDEVSGVTGDFLDYDCYEIPMNGAKESFNVSVTLGIVFGILLTKKV